MQDWDPKKPFGYLETVGRSSLRAASSFLRSCPNLPQTIAQRLGDTDPKDQLSRGLLEVGPSKRRIGLLLAVCANAPLVTLLTSQVLHRLIYREDEELVRGLVLRALSNAAIADELREALHASCAAVLEHEYRMSHSATTNELAKHWLDALCDVAESVEGEISSYVNDIRQRDDQYEQTGQASVRDVDPGWHGPDRAPQPEFGDRGDLPYDYVKNCHEVLQESADPASKMKAIRRLVRHGASTGLEDTNQLLATIVSDESEVSYVRDVAYQALYEINKLPVEDWPEVRRAQGAFLFPDDVDWSLVRRYLGMNSPMAQE
jgi:hypothetical protein